MSMDKQTQTELEAAAFRRLVSHLRNRTDVQNIDLMNLAMACPMRSGRQNTRPKPRPSRKRLLPTALQEKASTEGEKRGYKAPGA